MSYFSVLPVNFAHVLHVIAWYLEAEASAEQRSTATLYLAKCLLSSGRIAFCCSVQVYAAQYKLLIRLRHCNIASLRSMSAFMPNRGRPPKASAASGVYVPSTQEMAAAAGTGLLMMGSGAVGTTSSPGRSAGLRASPGRGGGAGYYSSLAAGGGTGIGEVSTASKQRKRARLPSADEDDADDAMEGSRSEEESDEDADNKPRGKAAGKGRAARARPKVSKVKAKGGRQQDARAPKADDSGDDEEASELVKGSVEAALAARDTDLDDNIEDVEGEDEEEQLDDGAALSDADEGTARRPKRIHNQQLLAGAAAGGHASTLDYIMHDSHWRRGRHQQVR